MRTLIFTALFFVVATQSTARTSTISDADHILKPLVGATVVAEGLAWGQGDKGLGEYLLLPYGEKLYLGDAEYRRKHPNGRLVRIVGKLAIRHSKAVGTAQEQGYGSDFDYYALTVTELKLIEKVTLGFPEKQQ